MEGAEGPWRGRLRTAPQKRRASMRGCEPGEFEAGPIVLQHAASVLLRRVALSRRRRVTEARRRGGRGPASTGGSRAGRQSRSAWRTGGRFSLPIQRNAGSEGADAGETANADGTCPPQVGAATCWPCAWQRSPPAGAGADSSSHSSSSDADEKLSSSDRTRAYLSTRGNEITPWLG